MAKPRGFQYSQHGMGNLLSPDKARPMEVYRQSLTKRLKKVKVSLAGPKTDQPQRAQHGPPDADQ